MESGIGYIFHGMELICVVVLLLDNKFKYLNGCVYFVQRCRVPSLYYRARTLLIGTGLCGQCDMIGCPAAGGGGGGAEG